MRTLPYVLAPTALMVFLVGGSSLWAQEQKISCDTVPAPVRAAFEKEFAKAPMNSCVKETEKGKTEFEIISKESSSRLTARFQGDGKLVRAEQSVAMGSVPEPVKQALQKKHPDGEVTLAEKVTSDGAVTYEFRVKQKNRSVEVAFDPSGKEVKVKR
jgi:hypothetical protein